MKDEYKETSKNYGPIKVFWKNAFDFEIYEEDIDLIISDSGHLILSNSDSENASIQPCNNTAMIKPSFNIYKIQIFSFPKTVMSYIIENVNPKILRNLQKSCKYFFILQPYPICHRFLSVSELDYNIKFNGHSLQIPSNFNDLSNEINSTIIVSNSLLASRYV